ncbi:hypothetical protein GCM10025759_15360 [Lysobacter panacisoli]|uniref:Transcriptional regulator TetR C-terminal Proteobacteria type domain-containing protein n=1 Tax=Lysobacter panacisoli TaxID=1255263 RepID=A0ABP9LBL9_9GAMM
MVDRAVDDAVIGIDANGSPVTIDAAAWLICFVPGLRRQWWHRYAHARHKHVFALRPLGDGTWLLVEPWWTRMMVNVLTLDEAIRFLRWGAMGDILKVRESIPGRGSQMRGWANCSVLVSFLLGRSYWTWTPNGLYRKLRAETDVEAVDLTRFLRLHVMAEADRQSAKMLKCVPSRHDERLEDALFELGTAIVTAMTSAPVIDLHKVAVSESRRYHDAAIAYWTSGPERAIRRIRKVLIDAKRRGEIGFDDCEAAARRFLAMLRGNLQLEVVLGHHPSPSHKEVREHVEFVVAIFLRGAWRVAESRRGGSGDRKSRGHSPVATAAQLLIREVGESIRDIVRGDDWASVAGCAEALWSEYASCTGLAWEDASHRVRHAWESYGKRSAVSPP